jgi:hypothetical protein
MALLHPTNKTFDLSIVSVLGSKSPFHPVLDAFNASVSLAGAPKPMMYMEIPSVKARDGAVTTVTGQHITISDMAAFTNYSAAVLGKKTVTLVLQGRTGLKQPGLPKTMVSYNKTVTMNGMCSQPLGFGGILPDRIRAVLPPPSSPTNPQPCPYIDIYIYISYFFFFFFFFGAFLPNQLPLTVSGHQPSTGSPAFRWDRSNSSTSPKPTAPTFSPTS